MKKLLLILLVTTQYVYSADENNSTEALPDQLTRHEEMCSIVRHVGFWDQESLTQGGSMEEVMKIDDLMCEISCMQDAGMEYYLP